MKASAWYSSVIADDETAPLDSRDTRTRKMEMAQSPSRHKHRLSRGSHKQINTPNHALSPFMELGGRRELPLSNSASDASSPTLAGIQERFDARECAARRTMA